MQEHGAAAPGDPRAGVVVDLDNEIVEVVVTRQAVAARPALQANRLVVVPVGRVFAPGILGTDRPHGKMRFRADMAVGPPPQPRGKEDAAGGAAVALALVGLDAATTERNRYGPAISGEPAPAGVSRSGVNADHRQRPITHICLISD